MSRLNLPTTDDTILRRLKHLAREPVTSKVGVMGVDEWAWSKGQSFGTILVDLEQGRVVDVLAESSAEALAGWLTAHPGVTTITRDRHGRYAEGARRAAPDATQVADRFHLVRNLRQAVERELAVHRRDLRVPLSNPITPPAKPGGREKDQRDPSPIQCRRAAPESGRATAPGEAPAVSNDPANEGGGNESE